MQDFGAKFDLTHHNGAPVTDIISFKNTNLYSIVFLRQK